MLVYTHLLFGISLFLFLKDYFIGGNETIFLILILVGSILPDIDTRRSKVVEWSGIFGIIISFFSKHRGFFHSLFFAAALTTILKLFSGTYYAWALFIGLTGHLLTDLLTREGICLAYPLGERLRGPIKVGSWGEWIVQFVLLIFVAVRLTNVWP